MGIEKTISEYVEAIKAGLKNKDKIIEAMHVAAAIKNKQVAPDLEITPEAVGEILRRKEICAACSHNSVNAKKTGSYNSSLPYDHCVLCLCRIGGDDTKEYCLTCTCGAKAWNEAHPAFPPITVRWEAFENKK